MREDAATLSGQARADNSAAGTPRVLFLQGPPSPFARDIGDALRARGAEVHRINLCFGDWLFWRGRGAVSYRGSLKAWGDFVADFLTRHRITHVVYFADCFPYHRIAREVAARAGIATVAYEYGYLRPDWIICEPWGQSVFSTFPQDPDRIRRAAAALPSPDFARQYAFPFLAESAGDVVYHLGNYLLWFLWPRFRRDRVYNPVREYLSYPFRFRRARRAHRDAAALVDRLCEGGTPFFVVPLQMQNDYQIRLNSPYADQREFIGEVLASFARLAPAEAMLVVKVHPLDNGLEDWAGYVEHEARRLGIAGRVAWLDGGDLDRLTRAAAGMVTINSTSGMTAIRLGCPVKVMGIAVYDMPGLTHRNTLDTFWADPFRAPAGMAGDFLKVMAACCHVRGDFYGRAGRVAAARAIAERIVSGLPCPGIFEDSPPRLDRARAMGIPVDL